MVRGEWRMRVGGLRTQKLIAFYRVQEGNTDDYGGARTRHKVIPTRQNPGSGNAHAANSENHGNADLCPVAGSQRTYQEGG